MILQIYTIVHTLISLVAIFTGFVVLFGLLAGNRLDVWTKWFLITAVATIATMRAHYCGARVESLPGFGACARHFSARSAIMRLCSEELSPARDTRIPDSFTVASTVRWRCLPEHQRWPACLHE